MLKLLPYVAKNLFRNMRRTLLTILSVAVSLFLLGILFAVYASFYFTSASTDQAQRLITRHKVSLTQAMPKYYTEQIAAIPGVEVVAPQNWFGGIYIDSRPEHFFSRFAVDPQNIFDLYGEFEVPADQLQDFIDDRQGMAVGARTAERVGLKLGQRITIQGDIYPFDIEVTIRAIFHGPNDDLTFFHQKYLEESLPTEWGGMVGFFGIRATSPEVVPQVATAIDDHFRNAPAPTKTETEAAFQLSFINQIGNIKLFLMSIAGAIVFTIMLVSANTMAMSVRERIREVGVLKTLGFRSGAVFWLILSEAALLSAVGGVIGVAAAWFIAKGAGSVMAAYGMSLSLPLWSIPICIGAAVVIGVLSALVPAMSASNMRITEALRHTG
ncbi:MAG: FtsX-like permease family protein [Acidobacteria bacterium]|nr:FtsX-like permease family protein [Acidobacteriota bacterium]MDA1234597.1 FtsX-like permease family protein [Acidobacteriota bacterium]